MTAPGPTRRRIAALPWPARVALVTGLLYAFLAGVSLLENGIAGLGSDVHARLFDAASHPVAGVCMGILGTVLVQSSSVSTAAIVGMVGSGILGVDEAVPMIMGANVGTTVTNTLASLASLRRPQEFRGAFAAATVHDVFNLLSVAVLLPIELSTKALSRSAEWLSTLLVGGPGTTYRSPIKEAVRGPVEWVSGRIEALGVEGVLLGMLLFVVGLATIFLTLTVITRTMKSLVADRIESSINAVLGRSAGLVAMAAGLVMTVAVQSSTITTSMLVPLAAAGVVTLDNIYPITLGANVGTTVTALLAALATDRPEALTVAIVHTLFNVAGILIFYPVRVMRRLPVRGAERLADLAVTRRHRAVLYVVVAFIVVPLIGATALR